MDSDGFIYEKKNGTREVELGAGGNGFFLFFNFSIFHFFFKDFFNTPSSND